MNEEFKTWWDSSLHAASFKQHLPYPPPASTIAWAYAAWRAGQNVEREACAKVCEDLVAQYNLHSNFICARTIRARGEA